MELKPYYSIEEISNAITGLHMPVPQAIKTDVLRYAIPVEFGSPLLRYPIDTLAPPLQQQIQAIRTRAQPNEARSIHADASCFKGKELLEETLYLRHSCLNQCVSGKTYFAHTLETFDGRPVNLWNTELATDQMWLTLWIELTELGRLVDEEENWFDGLLADGLISTKELTSVTGVRPTFPAGFGKHTRRQPFRLYTKQPNRACQAICDWGNIYFEQNDSVPSIEDLRAFMKENAANVTLTVTNIQTAKGIDEVLLINGKRTTSRSFKEYYDKLTSSS